MGRAPALQRWTLSASISIPLPAPDVTLFWDADFRTVQTALPHIQFSVTLRRHREPNPSLFFPPKLCLMRSMPLRGGNSSGEVRESGQDVVAAAAVRLPGRRRCLPDRPGPPCHRHKPYGQRGPFVASWCKKVARYPGGHPCPSRSHSEGSSGVRSLQGPKQGSRVTLNVESAAARCRCHRNPWPPLHGLVLSVFVKKLDFFSFFPLSSFRFTKQQARSIGVWQWGWGPHSARRPQSPCAPALLWDQVCDKRELIHHDSVNLPCARRLILGMEALWLWANGR